MLATLPVHPIRMFLVLISCDIFFESDRLCFLLGLTTLIFNGLLVADFLLAITFESELLPAFLRHESMFHSAF